MQFDSPSFFAFVFFSVFVYLLLPHRFRWVWLLGTSLLFYKSFGASFGLLAYVIASNYLFGIGIEKLSGRWATLTFVAGILSNLVVLGWFKYFNFFAESLTQLAQFLHWNYAISHLALIVALGLSYYIFQAISYLIEIYNRRIEAEKHIGIFALYMVFFPRLVAGPIERPQNLLPQFRKSHNFEGARIISGLKLIAWGMFKKFVVANNLVVAVDSIYTHPTDHHGVVFIAATFLFAYQLYCDFSGYTDIVRGIAQIMGFHLTENFNHPYIARSVNEFWQRWHISLSTWIRDYLFIPLSRKGLQISKRRFPQLVQFIVTLSVMTLVGLWHGAQWTFVTWGFIHGLYLGVGALLRSRRIALPFAVRWQNIVSTLLTFSLVCFAWIFFRSNTLRDGVYIVTHLFDGVELQVLQNSISGFTWAALGISIILVEVIQYLQRHPELQARVLQQHAIIRWAAYYGFIVAILLLGRFQQSQFIYSGF
jgi:alginate O-acetyltransferase complex protein AlgI